MFALNALMMSQPSGLWTFSNSGAYGNRVIWLDASDASTLSVTGNALDSWTDKTGNGNTVTASGSARPSSGTRTINGLNAIDFDAASAHKMSKVSATDLGTGNLGYYYLAVIIPDAASGDANPFSYQEGSGAQIGGRTISFSCGNTGNELTTRHSNGFRICADTFTVGNPTIAASAKAAGAGMAGIEWRKDGAVSSTSGSTSNLSYTGASKSFCLGSLAINNLNYFDGLLAELIMISTPPTTAQKEELEGYVAHKWGITLPGAHPYFSSPPTA